jgi:hypothetical protein
MKSKFMITLTLWMLFVLLESASAATPAERIRDRLPAIDSMKMAAKVGENADGYLDARASLSTEERDLMEAENADRRFLYQSIADRTGQSVDAIGRQRAVRVFELSKPGVWLKDANGKWFQK